MRHVTIDGDNLTLEQIKAVVFNNVPVSLSTKAISKVTKCRKYVEKIVFEGKIVYGLTTGFGKFSNIIISSEHLEELQENLIVSHAVGVGASYTKEQTRAVMLLRANVLAKGYSGIRLQTLQTLIDMLNVGVHPLIPMHGSVGASGDLAPLSHLALVLLGKGHAEYKGKILKGSDALNKAGIKPVKLAAKEGLALNNGTQVMAGIGVLAFIDSGQLIKAADVIAAMSIDALKGTPCAFDPIIHQLRPHEGQLKSAQNLYNLLNNSPLRLSHLNCVNLQDAYSLRCTPQVHGAVRDALNYVKQTIEIEINSATDNPLIFPDEDKVISGGNFHGEPLAIALDTMAIAISELASISERRIEQMLNPTLNRELPPFLAARPGLDSGFMIAQLTAASLVSENKVLAHPASVDNIPTSANQEDHVSMGSISANKVVKIIDNVYTVLAIELLIALQALDYRCYPSSPLIEAIRKELRQYIKPLEQDRILYPEILYCKKWLKSNRLGYLAKKHCPLL